MTREIKFRAWYNDQMYYGVWPFGAHALCRDNFGRPELLGFDGIVMQYTGLRDKSGKEIYEGDVVRSRHGIATVSFHNASFIFKWDFSALNELMHVWKEDGAVQVEVISNIYEHPNLLNPDGEK